MEISPVLDDERDSLAGRPEAVPTLSGLQIFVDERRGQVRLEGQLVFDQHRRFRAAMQEWLADPTLDPLQLDLSGLQYVDSSGLGLFLILKDQADAARRPMRLLNPSPLVAQIFEVAGFDRLFRVVREGPR